MIQGDTRKVKDIRNKKKTNHEKNQQQKRKTVSQVNKIDLMHILQIEKKRNGFINIKTESKSQTKRLFSTKAEKESILE